MIYSETENPKCCMCVYAEKVVSGNAECSFKGIVPEDFCCKKFKYDIFKKTIKPKKVLRKHNFSEEDFMI